MAEKKQKLPATQELYEELDFLNTQIAELTTELNKLGTDICKARKRQDVLQGIRHNHQTRLNLIKHIYLFDE